MSPTLYTVPSDSTSSTSLDGKTHTHTYINKLTNTALTATIQQINLNKRSIFFALLLSNSPESVKNRTDVFYLQPEQNVHTHRSESILNN